MLLQLQPGQGVVTAQRKKENGRPRDNRQGDRFSPGRTPEARPDLQFKEAFKKFRAQESQQVEEPPQFNAMGELVSTFPGRQGYDINFLGRPLPLPTLHESVRGQAAELIGKPGETELKYGNFSIVMNGERRQPFFTAVNIDGPNVVDVPRDGNWTIDGRIRRDQQLGNEAYKSNDIDKGHMVRRRDAAWGDNPHRSANDTFAYTNAALQHAALNQKEWLELENHVLDQVKAKGMRATVITGPVLKDTDPLFNNKGKMDRPTQMPQEFFKVVVWNDPKQGLKASAFVLSQEDFVGGRSLFKSDTFETGRFELYQVPLAKLEEMTRLDFGDLADSRKEIRLVETPADAVVAR
jgi:endonuclease G